MKSRSSTSGAAASRSAARTLLTYAFAADVLQRIDDRTVRDGLEALARERFVDIPAAVGDGGGR